MEDIILIWLGGENTVATAHPETQIIIVRDKLMPGLHTFVRSPHDPMQFIWVAHENQEV